MPDGRVTFDSPEYNMLYLAQLTNLSGVTESKHLRRPLVLGAAGPAAGDQAGGEGRGRDPAQRTYSRCRQPGGNKAEPRGQC